MNNCLNCGSPAASPDGKAPLCSTCQGEAKGRERGVSFMREIQSREQNTRDNAGIVAAGLLRKFIDNEKGQNRPEVTAAQRSY